MSESDDLIVHYFNDNATNKEIVSYLRIHGVSISLATVKRRLRNLGLKRRVPDEDHEFIREQILKELLTSSSNFGYRKMWAALKGKGVQVKRSTVGMILAEVDPGGVECRKKRRLRRRLYTNPGPDFLWHIDGYDKLKPYGISVHGCVDGYSRKIIWMEVSPTNKQPQIIAGYYMNIVSEMGAVPARIRSDNGTENSIIESLQIALRTDHDDEWAGLKSYIVGTSPANQRIESMWSQFNKDRPLWWRHLFAEVSSLGYFDSSNLVMKECIRFCFMHLIRQEINDFVERWNRHTLAPSKGAIAPRGKPNTLYFLPHLQGAESFRKSVSTNDLQQLFINDVVTQDKEDCSSVFLEFVHLYLLSIGHEVVTRPKSTENALKLYFILLEAIEFYS